MRSVKRREFVTLLGGAVVAWPFAARTQETVKKIGFLNPSPFTIHATYAVFSDALRGLGWIEGKNLAVERRSAENQLERLPALAAELVRLNVDVIVATGTLAPLAAKQATTTIPIVMANAGDPLGSGLVASLSRPGGNITGMSLMAPDLGGKRLAMLKEILPGFSRVAVLWNADNPYSALVFKETQAASQALNIQVQSMELRGPDDFGRTFEVLMGRRPDALIAVEDPLTLSLSNRKLIADFVARYRLPALYGLREFVADGGLLSYGASLADLYRRTAVYVDKIFKGAKPAELPVQQPTAFELVINLKTAKSIGLTIPATLIALADEVIE